jgi:hypothetical protein
MYDMKWQEESPGEDLSNAVVRWFQEIGVLVRSEDHAAVRPYLVPSSNSVTQFGQ